MTRVGVRLAIPLVVGVAWICVLAPLCAVGGGPGPSGALAGTDALSTASPPLVNTTVVATIPIPVFPREEPVTSMPPATLDPASGDLFLPEGGSVVVISGANNSVIATVPVYAGPYAALAGLTYDPANFDLYAPGTQASEMQLEGQVNVSVLSGSTGHVVGTIPLAGNYNAAIFPATFDPANGDLYQPLYDTGSTGNVSVISGTSNTVVATIPVGGNDPVTPVLDPSNGDLYVVNADSHTVDVVSGTTNAVVATIPLNLSAQAWPWVPLYDPLNQELYVPIQSTVGGGAVDIISTTTDSLVETLLTNSWPATPVLDPNTDQLFIAGADFLFVLNGASNAWLGALSIPSYLETAPTLVDTPYWALYVENRNFVGFSIVSEPTDTVVANMTLGEPGSIILDSPTFDGRNGELYVPDWSGSVFVIGSSASHPANELYPLILVGVAVAMGAGIAVAIYSRRRSREPAPVDVPPS